MFSHYHYYFLYQTVILQKKEKYMNIYEHILYIIICLYMFIYTYIYLYIFLHKKFFTEIFSINRFCLISNANMIDIECPTLCQISSNSLPTSSDITDCAWNLLLFWHQKFIADYSKSISSDLTIRVCMCACVHVCVRACVRACMRARARACVCVLHKS